MEIKLNILHLLTLLFVILNLAGVIDWAWWLVLLPSLIWLGWWLLAFIFIFCILIVTIIANLID